jgi:outer membrane protein
MLMGVFADGLMRACILLLASSSLCYQSAFAFGVPDVLDDPLWTKPPILSLGPTLPDGALVKCPAQVDLSQALGLGEVIDLALCNNPIIKQDWAAIKIQAGAVGEARSAYLPTANATYGPRQQTQVNYPQSLYNANSIANGKMSYANLTWRLFDFGGRAANRASSNYLLGAALASHDASIQKVMAATIQGYFDVLTAGATVKAKVQATDFSKSSWEATLRRENKGVSAKSDTLQAQTVLAKAQLESSRANGAYRKAQASLIFAMGLPTTTTLTLQEPSEHPQRQDIKDLNAWLLEAQEDHPAIKAAKAQWESAKEKITAARAAGMPTLDFVGNFYQNGYPNQGVQPTKSNTTTVGLTFNIPIFEGFGTTYKIRGQQAQAEKAVADLEDATNQILTEIVKSHADAISSLANLESSQKLLEVASAAVNSSVKRYDKGVADILELLTTQMALAEAQQERIRCLAEYRSARLRLLANAGALDKLGDK